MYWEVPVCAVVTPEADPSPSAVLSVLVGLLLFRVPSPLSLDWAGFLFWAFALEEPRWDPPLPLLGVVSSRGPLGGWCLLPFFAVVAVATFTIAYLSSICQTERNLFTTERALPSYHGRSCLAMNLLFRLSMSFP